MAMNPSKEEAEPLLVQTDSSHEGGASQDSENDSSHARTSQKTISISLQKALGRSDNYDPLSERDTLHATSNCDTMIHLLKGNIGTGILAMPEAFKNAGLAVGTIGTLLLGAICMHTMHILVDCSHELCRRTQTPSLNFAEVAEISFKVGPPLLRRFAVSARILINTFLCVTQLGFCCVYFVFVADNLKMVVNAHLGVDWTNAEYMAFLLLPMIFLNYVKNLKYLAPFSMVANIFMAVGLAIIFVYIFKDGYLPINRPDITKGFSGWHQFPLYFGTAIYSFEGIGMILPLENKMKTPHDFKGWNGVLNTSMVIVGCLYTAVGFFGYLKYGASIQSSITLNLPQETLAECVRVMMALSIFLSYALQFYVPMDIVWPHIKAFIPTERMQILAEYAFRTVLVIITFTLAEMIPRLGLFISLVGAVSSSTLALIFPPIINMLTYWNDGYGKYYWILWKDLLVLVFGLIGFVAGTYASMNEILRD